MAFNWQIPNITNDIKMNSSILNEIKNNLDTLSDSCLTNKGTNYIGYCTGHNSSICTANYTSERSTYRDGHH